MATTTNFGWETPDDTDLVKDGAAAIRTALGGVDTSFVDLKGGTTGQVLKKATNTDLDFVWSSDSVGMTNPMTTTGDTIYSSSGSTPARLGIGTTGQILTVSGGVPTWASPAGGGKVLQVVFASYDTQVDTTSTTYADTGLTATITPSSASSKVLVLVSQAGCRKDSDQNAWLKLKLRRGASTDLIIFSEWGGQSSASTNTNQEFGSSSCSWLDSPATTSATTYKTMLARGSAGGASVQYAGARSSITLLEIGA
jgi:hypothetical protein